MDNDEVQREARRLDRYGFSDEDTDRLAAGIVAERKAWARMVYAGEALSRWLQRDPASAEAQAAVVERAAARRALMDLGIDYDALRDQERARREAP